MRLQLHSKKEEVPDVTTFSFIPEEKVTWDAGQYMHYVLPHENADNRGEERWFTISSAPSEEEIRITTRNSGDKGSTFKKALFSLPIGATIEADGPEGDFTLSNPETPVVFIAGGIGITPFRSILKDLDSKGASINGTLLYANRNENVAFKEELESIKAKYPSFDIKYITSPQQIDEEYIRSAVPDLQVPIFYLSGPEGMVRALDGVLTALNVPKEHIKLDDFPGYDWPLMQALGTN